jgi:hypothetical protein
MDVRSIAPAELYSAIIENNPEAIEDNLREFGFKFGENPTGNDLLQAILSLKVGRSNIQFVELASRLINVQLKPEGANYQELLTLLDNNIGSLIVENYLANAPKDIDIVYSSELNRLKWMSYIGAFALLVIAVGFLLYIARPKVIKNG